MADEIQSANVVRVMREGDRWLALIGPDPQRGILGVGINPISAIVNLAGRCAKHGWPFDPTWRPGKTALHDA